MTEMKLIAGTEVKSSLMRGMAPMPVTPRTQALTTDGPTEFGRPVGRVASSPNTQVLSGWPCSAFARSVVASARAVVSVFGGAVSGVFVLVILSGCLSMFQTARIPMTSLLWEVEWYGHLQLIYQSWDVSPAPSPVMSEKP